MSDEIQVRVSLRVRKGSLDYQSRPTSFNADMAGSKGPSPGVLSVTTAGTNVSFAQLTSPSMCRLQNLDDVNRVEWGVHDGALFHPVGELLPGESCVIRLSRNLGEEEDAPGTGTTGVINAFYLRAVGATCAVLVEAFDL